jgi:hypothetical protein
MNTVLITALRESRGYLQDQGWHQTARLMTFAATEIERLSARVRALEEEALPGRSHIASARPAIPPPTPPP